MLKYLRCFLVMMTVVWLCGCTKSEAVRDYFPVQPNTMYVYASPDNDALNQRIFVTYLNGNRAQRWVGSTYFNSTEVIEFNDKDNEIRLRYGDGSFYCFEDVTGAEANQDMLIMKGPLKQNAKWTVTSNADINVETTITSMNATVETDSGTYQAMELTTSYSNGRMQKEYYAKAVGLVKAEYTDEKGTFSFSLVKVMTDVNADAQTAFFYLNPNPEGEEDRVVEGMQTIKVSTDMDLAAAFTEALKKPYEGYTSYFPADAKINSLFVDRLNDGLVIDLSASFVENLNMDGETEMLALQALTDTLGRFYGVQRVMPLIDGDIYKSKNMAFEKGQFLTVVYPEV